MISAEIYMHDLNRGYAIPPRDSASQRDDSPGQIRGGIADVAGGFSILKMLISKGCPRADPFTNENGPTERC